MFESTHKSPSEAVWERISIEKTPNGRVTITIEEHNWTTHRECSFIVIDNVAGAIAEFSKEVV